MKTICSAFLLPCALLYSLPNYSQKNENDSLNVNVFLERLTPCNVPLTNNNCNQIFNNNFTPIWADCFNSWDFSPFARCFPDWGLTHGSPQINQAGPLIGPNINHASMWAYNNAIRPNDNFIGEGIATKIPNLLPGRKYAIAFYRRTRPQPTFTPYPNLDEINIRLMKCADYVTMTNVPSSSIPIPDPPVNSQAIYCETNVNRPNWQRVAQTFIADDNYDIVWIYPKQYAFQQWWLDFGQLELIDVTNFNAGPPPNPISPDCLATIGPLSPNCGVTGAVFTWHGPNGQTISAPANQQIQVNTADPMQVGVWTLQMDVPSIATTNNTCSNRLEVVPTVNVPACALPCAPRITPVGPIDYYVGLDNFTNGITLTSDKSTGNQWYYNGNLITGATAQSYTVGGGTPRTDANTGNYYVIVNGCQSNVVSLTFNRYGYGQFGEEIYSLGSKSHPVFSSNYYCYNTTNNVIRQFSLGSLATYAWNFPVYNPIGGTQTITLVPGSAAPNSNEALVNIGAPLYGPVGGLTATYVQGVADLYGRQIIIDYMHELSHPDYISTNQVVCAGRGLYVLNGASSPNEVEPGASGFDWESYDFGPNGIITSGPGIGQNTVTIPGRGAAQPMIVTFSAPSTITKHFYYNTGGCYKEEYNVTLDAGCRTFQKPDFSTTVFPNPATSNVTITVNKTTIKAVTLTDFMNSTVKQIKAKGQKTITINIADLKSGVYNCQIVTENGLENKKLVIKQ